jgi:lipopolysaccharide/colanic/teichoic acid biosynthesis glycosyltransferase
MALEHAHQRPPDVSRAAERLRRPHARALLAVKRASDILLASLLLLALVPVAALLALLLAFGRTGWLESRERVGRDGRTLRLWRFHRPPGALGRGLERIGAREIPVLVTVAAGKLSFVGPRVLLPGAPALGPRSLMAPGLLGPAQRGGAGSDSAAALDDAYVEEWTLLGDAKLLLGIGRGPLPARR